MLNSSLPYINSGTICDYVKAKLSAGHKHGTFFAISISDAPTTGSGQNYFMEYQAYDGTGNIRLFAQHITNRTMYISNMYNTDSALTSWSRYAAQSAIDELNSNFDNGHVALRNANTTVNNSSILEKAKALGNGATGLYWIYTQNATDSPNPGAISFALINVVGANYILIYVFLSQRVYYAACSQSTESLTFTKITAT